MPIYNFQNRFQDGDLNLGGGQLLENQTILNQQEHSYYNLNGESGKIQVPDDASFSGLFDNGGTYICKFNAFSSGESTESYFFTKTTGTGNILRFDAGEWHFAQFFSGANGDWVSTGTNIPLNKDSIVILIYNSSSTTNLPTLYVDGVEVGLIGTTPTGTSLSDSGSDLFLGNISADNGTFDGNKYSEIFLNREFTAAEAISFSSNPQKALDFSDEGGSNVNIVTVGIDRNFGTDVANRAAFDAAYTWASGGAAVITVVSNVFTSTMNTGAQGTILLGWSNALVIGKRYRLILNVTDLVEPVKVTGLNASATPYGIISSTGLFVLDFIAKDTDDLFIYPVSSTTTTIEITASSIDNLIHQVGGTVVLKGKDFTDAVAYDSSGNDNDGAVTTATRHNKQEALQLERDLEVGGDVTIVGAISKGSGSFKIDHPLTNMKDAYYLVHSFIEGPQADLIYRGRVALVDGSATINIDDAARMTKGTFLALCTNVQCFTTNESDWDDIKGSVVGNVLTIISENPECTADISWMVIGERKDQHMLDTGWTNEEGRIIVETLKPVIAEDLQEPVEKSQEE